MAVKAKALLRNISKQLKDNGKKKYALPDFPLTSSQSTLLMLELLYYFNPSTAIPLLDYFISFTSNERTCFSSNETIHKATGCKKRMIQYFKEELQKAGIVELRKKFGKKRFVDGRENYTTEIIFKPEAAIQLVALRRQIKDLKNFKNCSKLLKEVVIDNGLSFSEINSFVNKQLTAQINSVHGVSKSQHSKSVHPYSSLTFSYKNLSPFGGSNLMKEQEKPGSLYVGKATFNYVDAIITLQEEGVNNEAIRKMLKLLGHDSLSFILKALQRAKELGIKIDHPGQYAWQVGRTYQEKAMLGRQRLYD